MKNLYIIGGTLPRNIFRDQEENICIFTMKRENLLSKMYELQKCENLVKII